MIECECWESESNIVGVSEGDEKMSIEYLEVYTIHLLPHALAAAHMDAKGTWCQG